MVSECTTCHNETGESQICLHVLEMVVGHNRCHDLEVTFGSQLSYSQLYEGSYDSFEFFGGYFIRSN